MRIGAHLFALLGALSLGAAGAKSPPAPHPFLAGGYTEAVFNVSDLAAAEAFYVEVAGWAVRARGAVDPALLRAYGVTNPARARAVLLANPGTQRGYLRLIEYTDVMQTTMRAATQAWDTGGWFDVNVRVRDMTSTRAAFARHGWQAVSEPVRFEFGPFVVEEWLPRGPDGVVFALIQRFQPPLTGWPHLKKMSRLFNATQVVKDLDAARAFYVDALGFRPYLEHRGASERAGPNVLGLPHNLATDIVRRVAILHPTGTNEGSIELLTFEGASGRDVSAHTAPPNLGIASLRFEVSDRARFDRRVADAGLDRVYPWTVVRLPGVGKVAITGVRGPEGAWLEFYAPPGAAE